MLQWRKRGSDDPMYNPTRDVAHFYPDLIKTVCGLLEDYKDPHLQPLIEAGQVTMDDLGEAAGAYCKFMNLAHKEVDETIESGLTKAGWFEVKPLARIAFMYYVGTCTSATFFRGIREVSEVGQKGPVTTIARLMWSVKRMMIFARMTGFQRFCYKWFRPWRAWQWRHWKIKKD